MSLASALSRFLFAANATLLLISPALAGDGKEAEPAYPAGYIEEAPLPEGFPPPSEVGQVVEKSYPLCRTYSAEGNNAFMRCFAYLSKQKHEMTAPVIMSYRPKEADAKQPPLRDLRFVDVARMHFILEKPTLDQPKQEGPVQVADLPKLRVLSVAFQGEMTADALADAERKLEEELSRRNDLIAAGEKRVLGYNSPMVKRGMNFWEVQVPVESRVTAPTSEAP